MPKAVALLGTRLRAVVWTSSWLLASAAAAQSTSLSPVALGQLLGPAPAIAAKATPIWPIRAFLQAESLQAAGRANDAARVYRELVEFAASDPYHDTWGADGLTAFALYRWLQRHATTGDTEAEPFKQMADLADKVLATRLVRSAFAGRATLVYVPLLEEQLLLALARGARQAGDLRRSGGYVLDFLGRALHPEAITTSDPLYASMLAQKLATPDRVALLRGKRLLELRQAEQARPLLSQAMKSADLQTKLESEFLYVMASPQLDREVRRGHFEEVAQYATNDALAQYALVRAGLLYDPGDPEFAMFLQRAVNEYKRAGATDEALDWLSWGARIGGRLDEGVQWLQQFQQLQPASLRLPPLAIETALALVWRGQAKDADAADRILADLIELQPQSDEIARAWFWRGRIAEQHEPAQQARDFFMQAAQADRHGYYGLRARMHLASGPGAKTHLRVQSKQLIAELRRAYDEPTPALPIESNVYLSRLDFALEHKLYRAALQGELSLRNTDPSRRVQDMSFEELDRTGLIAPIAVIMALRQDLFAGVDRDGKTATRLALAARVGQTEADWPALLSLVHPALLHPNSRRSETLRAPGYLHVAYPSVYHELIRDAAARYQVAPSLLYAIMREESFFYPAALSSKQALGLFQFIPSTFDALARQWDLLGPNTAPDRSSYLMDKKLSIELGARWFGQELGDFKDHPLQALVAHLYSPAVVREWSNRVWTARGWSDDVETMVESLRRQDLIWKGTVAGGRSARRFARNVLTDIMIVDAVGLFDNALAPR
ncbi:MAG: transglycosylase SLT domain-containing protein [Burkholderiales bacterium]|nr:transglycosylase SLT domain-containing protein [Burkholderiales bacterium]